VAPADPASSPPPRQTNTTSSATSASVWTGRPKPAQQRYPLGLAVT
jgi:hypothetical protein